ncbi:hypothetical protein E2562_034944 [Oryza meyeriana var. granulata]|uniref:Uncharacterized protein n=1 Tax=Oryza meyeriana var. granulata TaxID=110450 RepID=A0A6G1DAZ6_9ORYZ|nr:hypothetical protein E2562_034944 [Oryza meyeriana var. granulata]
MSSRAVGGSANPDPATSCSTAASARSGSLAPPRLQRVLRRRLLSAEELAELGNPLLSLPTTSTSTSSVILASRVLSRDSGVLFGVATWPSCHR